MLLCLLAAATGSSVHATANFATTKDFAAIQSTWRDSQTALLSVERLESLPSTLLKASDDNFVFVGRVQKVCAPRPCS